MSGRAFLLFTLTLLVAMTWAQYHPIILILVSLIVVLAVIGCLVVLFWKKRTAKKRLMCGFGALGIVVWISVLMANFNYSLWDLFLIKINSSEYKLCMESGEIFDAKDRLAVCHKDDEWWRYGFVRAIIYDSSGQIARVPASRDVEWRRAALSLDKQAPFGIVGFKVRRLSGNFYLVTFYDVLDQDII